MLKPKPVPSPVGFVVKKGWNILSRMDEGIPGPLSETEIKKEDPRPPSTADVTRFAEFARSAAF